MNRLVAMISAGRYAELESSARELTIRHPDSGVAWKALGVSLQLQHKDALPALQRAAAILPSDAEAHSNLGIALLDVGRLDDAVASFRRALEIKPDYADVHNNLGNALRSLGRIDDAVACYERSLQSNPGQADVHNNLGNALHSLGRIEDAVASFRRALALKPGSAEAHSGLGNALLSLGRADEAAASYHRALELEPAYAAVHNNLGHALLALGRLAEAMASCHRALEIKPDFAEAHSNLGNVLLDIGRLEDAEASYRRALSIKPDFADAHSNLGIALRLQGRTAEAEASCRRALELNPALAPAITVLADAQADKGQFAAAEDLYRRAIAVEPDLAEAWAGIAYLRKMTGEDAPWLAEAQRIVAKNPAPRKEVLLRYAIGKYFDDVRDFDQAFLHYQRANELTKLHRVKHDRQQLTQFIDELIQSYGREWVDQARIHGVASARPVFIVGVPRSGTSLAEQILASHPAVFGAGELTFWNSASATYQSTAPRGEVIGSLLSKLSTDYLRLLEEFSADALRVVDKMPTNFMFLGLIHAALPDARIIHMRRNPIDTCLSIYFQDFSAILSCANDLGDLAHYYAEYVRLMQHWHSILPAGAILDVPYEGLVDDQEAWSRKMLEFVGLPWDPKCLEFHQSSRSVVTASKWQVRQKISKSSVERWRNYAKHVGPLLTLLEQR